MTTTIPNTLSQRHGYDFAFPSFDGITAPEAGLTKREYFAVMAMVGMIKKYPPEGAAHWAVVQADALIEALAKHAQPATGGEDNNGR